MSINVMFRADSSSIIGTGHIMRCLTLADSLKEKGVEISFISIKEKGNLIQLIEEKGYKVYKLPIKSDEKKTLDILKNQKSTIDWLIIDHYNIDTFWETKFNKFVKKIMVIDDLANRKHNCELLLDQNYYLKKNRYKGLISNKCKQLIGPDFALIKKEFLKLRKKLEPRTGKVKQILVFMGGADFTNETSKILKAIKLLNNPGIKFNIVIGPANQYYNKLKKEIAKISNAVCFYNINNMAELMFNADLCIGACGSTTWERLIMGIPSIVIIIADNQKENAESLDKKECIINLGFYNKVTIKNVFTKIEYLINNPNIIKRMSKKAQKIVDGKGTGRVTNILLKAGQ